MFGAHLVAELEGFIKGSWSESFGHRSLVYRIPKTKEICPLTWGPLPQKLIMTFSFLHALWTLELVTLLGTQRHLSPMAPTDRQAAMVGVALHAEKKQFFGCFNSPLVEGRWPGRNVLKSYFFDSQSYAIIIKWRFKGLDVFFASIPCFFPKMSIHFILPEKGGGVGLPMRLPWKHRACLYNSTGKEQQLMQQLPSEISRSGNSWQKTSINTSKTTWKMP